MAAVTPDNRIRGLVLALSFGAEINAVLGVDSLAGGLRDGALDVLCSGVLVLAIVVGSARWSLSGRPARRRSTGFPGW